ncbi:MAG TPA: NAD(P)-dependent alcohol dehydrogenase [Solirubrobacteraceae bacterium]|nr:NAD(P)-dependent alcohol dehydrogenase [Solirubrobacteraceae bacterium]
MPATPALSTPSAGARFEQTTIERRELGERDVAIDVKFCGICHSDIHQVRDEWGGSIFPMVPGHEIAGVVTAVGAAVSAFAPGDRVGVGCMVDSCEECEYCRAGEEQFCTKRAVWTYNGRDYDGNVTYGGYSRELVVKDRFVARIPDALDLQDAAPLLCAGITTYVPLKHWRVGEGTNVAVIGMGGLGHVAVQIAAAMGAEVTVLSQSLSKQDDGLRFGAKHYYATAERETFKELRSSFDFILNTVSANLDVNAYLSLLRVDGTMVDVGAPSQPDSIHAFMLIAGRRSLAGSSIGGMTDTQEMLDFCARHGVKPQIELIGADEVDGAYDRVVNSDVRYRFVIDAATIGAATG